MAKLRVVFNGKQAGAKYQRGTARNGRAVLTSLRQTAEDLAETIVTQGRADIAKAGNFGVRWQEGLQARVGEGGGRIRVTVTMGGEPPVQFWRVFQHGATIQGRPLLWIPLSFASDAKRVRARDYPGSLFRVDRAGKAPLLMTKVGARAEAKYFGKEQVTIPKKFHLIEIATRAARQLTRIYRQHFRRNRSGR